MNLDDKHVDFKVSEHFNYSEMVTTNHQKLKVENWDKGMDYLENMKYMARWLEEIRQQWGKPIVLNSGFRCKALNKAIGGAHQSRHMTAEAVDIRCDSKETARKMVQTIIYVATVTRSCSDRKFVELNHGYFDELILEHKDKSWWVHFAAKRVFKENRNKLIT